MFAISSVSVQNGETIETKRNTYNLWIYRTNWLYAEMWMVTVYMLLWRMWCLFGTMYGRIWSLHQFIFWQFSVNIMIQQILYIFVFVTGFVNATCCGCLCKKTEIGSPRRDKRRNNCNDCGCNCFWLCDGEGAIYMMICIIIAIILLLPVVIYVIWYWCFFLI